MKKSLKWLLPIGALVLLAAVAAAVLLFGGAPNAPASEIVSTTVPADTEQKIYWNIEWGEYPLDENGQTTRPRAGNLYRIRMAVDGEQTDVFIDSSSVMAYADSLYCMGLELDEENKVLRVVPIEEFTAGEAVKDWYIQEFDDTGVVCNMVGNFKGPSFRLPIDENTRIYDVSGEGLLVGIPGQLMVEGKINAVMGTQGALSHIWVEEPFQPASPYWNVERLYDSKNQMTKRTPDTLGYYTFLMAVDGQQVEVRTRDLTVASAIDSYAAKCMHLEFDEEGNVKAARATRYATGNTSKASWHHVTQINEDGSFVAEKFAAGSDQGNVTTCVLTPDCKIYDVSSQGAYVGEPTQLKLYDQVHCLRDEWGDVCIVYVVNRMIDGKIYWNVDRRWDASAQVSTRYPDAQGYYSFLMAVEGRQVTLRTKDKACADFIDGRAAMCCTLVVEGDVITAYGFANKHVDGTTFASWYDVTAINGDQITVQKNGAGADQGTVKTGVLDPECAIFNVSDKASMEGERTTLQVGDRIHAMSRLDGTLRIIYVVERYVNWPVYWNLDRLYDSTAKASTRKPDAEGWYRFDMVSYTGPVTLKCKDKELVDYIDSRAAKTTALRVVNGVILDATQPNKTSAFKKGTFIDYGLVTGISGKTITYTKNGKTATGTLAADAKLIGVFGTPYGPVDSIQVGDTVYGFSNAWGQGSLVYVVTRPMDWPVYWNLERKYDTQSKTSTRTPDGEGWYHFDMVSYTGPVTLKCKDKALVDYIDSRAAKTTALKVKDGQILDATQPNKTVSYQGGTFADYADVTGVSGSQVTCLKNGKTSTGTLAADCKIVGVHQEPYGPLESVQKGDQIYGFMGKDGQGSLVYVVKRQNYGYCDLCQEEVLWKLWNGSSSLGEGHYVLESDVTVPTRMSIAKGTQVTLDLNGHTVTGGTACTRIFNILGTLNLLDSKGTGKVVSTAEDVTIAPVFYVQKDGLFNLYGGTLTAAAPAKECGIGVVFESTMNMYGGTITGGSFTAAHTAADNKGGGNLGIFSTGVFTMYGGQISGGTSACNGGNVYMNGKNAVFTMLGGTVTGGKAAVGGGVYGKGHVTLGGSAKITGNEGGNLYLLAGSRIAIASDLTDGAVGITLQAGSGSFTDTVEEKAATWFASDAQGGTIVWNPEGALEVKLPVQAHEHCLCVSGLDHTCQTAEFLPWSDSSSLPVSGSYYLTTDVTLAVDAAQAVTVENTLSLCLNGHTVTNTDRVFRVNGTLDLTDCRGTGILTAANSGKRYGNMGGVVYVAGGAFNLYGGTVKNGKANNGGNIALNSGATMNMYGGTVSGGSGPEGNMVNGGNINIYSASDTLNMYHGTVSGGTVNRYSGNIRVAGTLNVTGGTISGGTAGVGGGNIYGLGGSTIRLANCTITGGKVTEDTKKGGGLWTGGTLTLGDGVNITGNTGSNLYIPTGTLLMLPPEGTVSIGITLQGGTGVFTDAVQESAVAWFASDEGYKLIWNTDGKLEFLPEVPPVTGHTHCLCAGSLKEENSHACANVTFEPWENTDSLPTSGNYYLTGNVTVTTTGVQGVLIATGDALNLCLNGYKISCTERTFTVNGTLNITDCGQEGSVTGNTAPTRGNNGGVAYVKNGTLSLYAGTVQGGSAPNGGNFSVGENGILNIYGGTVKAGVAKGSVSSNGSGGNIYLFSSSVLNLYGGEISDGHGITGKNVNGGNVNIDGTQAVMNMHGGIVSGGTVNRYSGNIRVAGTLNVTGGTISGGTAGVGGGNIYGLSGSKISLADCEITGGKLTDSASQAKGGGIWSIGSVTLSGKVVIKDNLGSDMTVNANSLTVKDLAEGSEIWVTANYTNLANSFGTIADPADAAYFKSSAAARTVSCTGGKLYITEE